MEPAHSVFQQDRDKMSVLVVGTDGVIGSRLSRVLAHAGRSVIETTRRLTEPAACRIHLDLASTDSFDVLPRCRAAVLCAAVTSMESCQRDPAATRQINVTNTVRLARQLMATGTHVIFLSSNTVFDGSYPYVKATDRICPKTEYGRQKADAESSLLGLRGAVTIVRLSKISFPEMPLMLGWINNLSAGRTISPYSDRRMSPLPLSLVVELLRRVIEIGLTGIIQLSATSDISYFEAALYLAHQLNYNDKLIRPVSFVKGESDHSPMNTTLESNGIEGLYLEAPSPFAALDEFVMRNTCRH